MGNKIVSRIRKKRGNNMDYQNTFKRYEIKYLLNRQQKEKVLETMTQYMKLDDYGRTTICNIYFDTPDSLLIRRSLDKPVYKEKLRIRSYGTASKNSKVFVELKKKYKSVVYKRRISVPEKEAMNYICNGIKPGLHNQITEEIDYFCDFYKNLEPAVYLSYEREAYYGLSDKELRVTFDENILWRTENISLCAPVYGNKILDDGYTLMEVKIAGAVPVWLAHVMSENGIYQTSFSKYGSAYMQMIRNNESDKTGGRQYA